MVFINYIVDTHAFSTVLCHNIFSGKGLLYIFILVEVLAKYVPNFNLTSMNKERMKPECKTLNE